MYDYHDALGRLVRRGQGRRSAQVALEIDRGSLEVKLSSLGKVTARLSGDFAKLGRSIFLPPREVLTLFPGFCKGGIGKLGGELDARSEGTKAVDFVGVRDEAFYFLEVKDFRGHRIENAKRQREELPLEIGLKVRDTLAGVAGAYAKVGGTDWIERCGATLTARKGQVRVVVWIADDPPGPSEPRQKRAVRDSERLNRIKQKLAWLTSRVLVEDPLEATIPGVIAENLPGAAQR